MLQQYFSPSEKFWLDWIADCPDQAQNLCEKALSEDHKYLGVSLKYSEILIENKSNANTIADVIDFWTLMFKSEEVHKMRLKVIEYLKNDESPRAKFILKKMVIFPNDSI